MMQTKLENPTQTTKTDWKQSLVNLLLDSGYSNRCDYLQHTTISRRMGDYLEKITITDGFTSYWAKNIYSSIESVVKTFLPHVNYDAAIELMRRYGVFEATEKSIRLLIGNDY
jgi:hypothetical protein